MANAAHRPDFFTPAPGEPTDACPLCGIHRQHAGNPEACGDGYRQPGCFYVDSQEAYGDMVDREAPDYG